jgi:hypothetical protein
MGDSDKDSLKFYYGKDKEDTPLDRTHCVIIRKAKSNLTANFSLWKCDLDLDKLREILKHVLIQKKNSYFVQDFKIIGDWAGKKKTKSHYIIVQRFDAQSRTIKKSKSFSVQLHDFDNDEIKEVLVDVLCNKRGKENGTEGKKE